MARKIIDIVWLNFSILFFAGIMMFLWTFKNIHWMISGGMAHDLFELLGPLFAMLLVMTSFFYFSSRFANNIIFNVFNLFILLGIMLPNCILYALGEHLIFINNAPFAMYEIIAFLFYLVSLIYFSARFFLLLKFREHNNKF